MAKKIVQNNQPMGEAREAINDNFTELYNRLNSGGGSASAFSKMSFLSTDRVGHGESNFTPDSGNLATGAENWIYHDATNNLYGLRPTSDGYYDIDVCVEVRSSDGNTSSFNADVSYGHLDISKRNVDDLTTSTLIARDWENKAYDQGADIINRVNETYVYLTTKDVIYVSYGMWVRGSSQSNTWGIDTNRSYISLSPSAAGGGGSHSNLNVSTEFKGDYILPDAIMLPITRSNTEQARLFHFTGFYGGTDGGNHTAIQYEWNIGQNERFTIAFANDTDGSYINADTAGSTTTNFNRLSEIPSQTSGQPSLKEIIADNRAIYYGGGSSSGSSSSSGGSGFSSSYSASFCKAYLAENSLLKHASWQTNNLNASNLESQSENWTHTQDNIVGIKIPSDGIYSINVNVEPNITNFSHWQTNVTSHNVRVMSKFANDATTAVELAHFNETKTSGNGSTLGVHLNLKNKFLNKDDFLYIENTTYNSSSTNFYADVDKSFVSIEKVNVGSASGASGLSEVVLSYSKFGSTIPDAIQLDAGGGRPITYVFRFISDSYVQFYDAGGSGERIQFNNDLTGTYLDTNSSHTRYSEDTTLQDIIDNGHAIYYGGGSSSGSSSSSGGMGSLEYLKNEYATGDPRMQFYTDLPDAIVTKDGDGAGALWDMRLQLGDIGIVGTQLQAYYIRVGGSYSIYFDLNTADGNYINDTSVNEDDVSDNASLKDYIENGRALYYGGGSSSSGNATGSGGASDFTSLTDTPSGLDAGSYLRVNTAGDAIEQVKTAPPDGGAGDNSSWHAISNFDSKLPDMIIVNANTGPVMGRLYHINGAQTSNIIMYTFNEFQGNQYMAYFDNDSTGGSARFSSAASGWSYYNGATTLQQVIDSGHAVYHGQKSGTSGVGSLAHTKSLHTGFYTELPDAILIQETDTDSGNVWDAVAKLAYIHHDGYKVSYRSDDNYRIQFDTTNDSDGLVIMTNETYNLDTSHTLRWYVENGRALYYGGGASVLPAGSIVQKVVEKLDAKQDVSGVGTTLISTQYTPRSTDSKLLLHFTATFMEDTNSLQQGAFYVDDALATSTVGWDWYTNPEGLNNRSTVTAQATHDNQDLNTKTIAMKLVLDNADRMDYHNLFLTVEEISNQPTELETGAPVQGMSSGGGASDFTSLTDTPSGLDAGSYLRVNSTGDAIEQIKTAPPDGGLGGVSVVQSISNFAGKLPDWIWAETESGDPVSMHLYHVEAAFITYQGWSRTNNAYYATFNNDATGSGASQNYSWGFLDGATTLQQIIDNGHAVYHGQKSGTSGVGSLNVIKAQAEQFYTELPDAIVATHVGGFESILRLKFAKSITAQPNGNNFYYEARVQGGTASGNSNDYVLVFTDDTDGTFNGHAGETDNFPADGSMDQNLRWFIENGRALYSGGGVDTTIVSAIINYDGTLTSASYDWIDSVSRDATHVGNYTITFKPGHFTAPPAITVTADSPEVPSFNHVSIEYNNVTVNGCNVYARKPSDGSQVSASFSIVAHHQDRINKVAPPATGGGVSSVAQLTDVDVTTATPTDGQVLVYDDSDSKWKPGAQSTDFVDLTDTPATLDAGSYLRVNAAGDAIEQIKTAPPDGGTGDNGVIQSSHTFNGKLPDRLINKSNGNYRIMDLYWVNSTGIYYAVPNSNGWIAFNPNGIGTNSGSMNPAPDYTNIQDFIDNGQSVYHGQKSGTTGVGNLDSIKSLVASSPNGGFYTELPDAIVSDVINQTPAYKGVFRLHWVKPNTTAGGTGWEIIYRAESFSSGDYSIRFLADADGTNITNTSSTNDGATSTMADNNLRWFIENGHALYYGAQPYGVKAWGKFNGKQGSGNNYNLTFTGGNIQSIVRVSTALYKVTFINPAPHADYSVSGSVNPNSAGGAYFGVREYDNPVTTTDFHIELRDSTNNYRNSDRISFQVVY